MFDSSFQQLVIQMHLFATVFMTGVVCFVQVIHYPVLRLAQTGVNIAAFNRRRTGWLVLPVMIVEMATALLLMGSSWVTLYGNYLLANLILLFLIWGITYVKMIPLHRRLDETPDDTTIDGLLRANLLRAILWLARSVLLLKFLG